MNTKNLAYLIGGSRAPLCLTATEDSLNLNTAVNITGPSVQLQKWPKSFIYTAFARKPTNLLLKTISVLIIKDGNQTILRD